MILPEPKLDVDAEESLFSPTKTNLHSIEPKNGNRIEQNNEKVATTRLVVKHQFRNEKKAIIMTRHRQECSFCCTAKGAQAFPSTRRAESKSCRVSTNIQKQKGNYYGEPSDQVRDLKKR